MTTDKDIQRALRGLGLYWGRIDGIAGPRTKAAIKKFQIVNPPLVADGIAGKRTLGVLFPRVMPSRDEDSSARKQGRFPRQRDIREFYGKVGKNQTKILLPYKMRIAWDLDKSVRKVTCHKKVAEFMQGIFEESLEEYGLEGIKVLRLDLYGGCLNVRKMRGGSRYSTHSWGIAMDIDPAHNQFRWTGRRAQLARSEYEPFWKIVKKHGATSLGRERDFDWMHFQFARL